MSRYKPRQFLEGGYTNFTDIKNSGVISLVQPAEIPMQSRSSLQASDTFLVDLFSLYDLPTVAQKEKVSEELLPQYDRYWTSRYEVQHSGFSSDHLVCSWIQRDCDADDLYRIIQPVQPLDRITVDYTELSEFKKHLRDFNVTGYVASFYSIDISDIVQHYHMVTDNVVKSPDIGAAEYHALQLFRPR